MGIAGGNRLYLVVAVAVIVIIVFVAYYWFGAGIYTSTPEPYTTTRVDEKYATSLANTVENFLYFMGTESVSTRVPAAYVIPAILPVLGVPMPGIALLEEATERVDSSSIYNATLFNTTYVVASSTNGEGKLRLHDIVEINGTSYANYTLSYNVISTKVQGNNSYTIRFSIKGTVLASTDYTKTVFRGYFEGKAFNETYREWFKTITVYDERYRPTEIRVYINNSSTPIVELYFNHDVRTAKIVIEGVNTTMGFAKGGINLELKDIRKERLGGVEAYIISYNVYSNNTSIGSVEYLVDANGIPVTLYNVNLRVERQDIYGEMKITFNMETTSLKFRE